MSFRHLLLSSAIGAALVTSFAPAQAQRSVDPSPTPAQTVKPPASTDSAPMKPAPRSTATSPTVTQTVKPGTGNDVTTPSNMASTTSATEGQTVKPRSERRQPRRTSKKTMPADNASASGGSGGTVAGRVENTTNSNSAGKPGKTP